MTATFACSFVVCFCTCTNTHVQREEAPVCRRAARSMVTRSLLFIVRLLCSPETCTISINRSIRVQDNHASHSYTRAAVAPVIGTQAKPFFSTKVLSWFVHPMGAQELARTRAYHNTYYVPAHNTSGTSCGRITTHITCRCTIKWSTPLTGTTRVS